MAMILENKLSNCSCGNGGSAAIWVLGAQSVAGWFGIVLCSAWQVPDQAGAEADAAPAARGGAAGVETAPGC